MHTVRVALWPLITLLALRAVLSVDMSHSDPSRNTVFVVSSSQHNPFLNLPLVWNSSRSTIMDALDLVSS
ncbi:hypothetical protein JVT61DRAFT_6660 [Boletus reticuloceps]|uniref:Uncharacterized protein n=1 Tax=Boletus reticuloceps TaxID=495285 RepID=A0A8I2YKS1_9AGAM|nr:hypothetical protein JVT61DRAFT_6660 [Boletus reticuloceps]